MRRFLKKFNNSIIGKILKAILRLLWFGVELGIIFLAVVVIVPRVTNNEKTLLGFRIFNVATGSMEPEYAVGDILISREKDPSKIKVGENIVYLGKSGGYEGKIITHSVIEIEQDENGDYLFHTKGKANTVEDPIVHQDQLYGAIVHNNEVLAFVCKILTNRYGLYFFVMVPIILHFFVGFVKIQEEKMEAEREQRRLEEEKRKKHKKRKPRPVEEVQELQAEEDIGEEVVKTPKKPKTKAVNTKNKEEEISEEETVEEEKTKTKKTTKSANTEKKEKKADATNTTKKSTKKKQAKEE